MISQGLISLAEVYVLYDCTRRIAIILTILSFVELTAMILLMWGTLPRVEFDDMCAVAVPLCDMVYFRSVTVRWPSHVLTFACLKLGLDILSKHRLGFHRV